MRYTHARTIMADHANWKLSYHCDLMFDYPRSNQNNDEEEPSEDHH